MSQAQKPTNKLYVKAAALLVAADSCYTALDTGSEAGFDETTNALTTETSASGLARAKATMSAQASGAIGNDIAQAYKLFTAAADATITGFGELSQATSGGDLWGWCTLAASVPLQGATSDTFAATFQWQFKLGA